MNARAVDAGPEPTYEEKNESIPQGFSLASAIGHSPKIVPDVREFAVQFGQFVRDDFQKYGTVR